MTEAGSASVPDSVFQLIEGSVDASVILDAERRILYYNRAYESMARLGGRKLRNAVDNGAKCFEVFPLAICEKACAGCLAASRSLNSARRTNPERPIPVSGSSCPARSLSAMSRTRTHFERWVDLRKRG